jgi:hypothetical protein
MPRIEVGGRRLWAQLERRKKCHRNVGQYRDRTSDPCDVNTGVAAELADFCGILRKASGNSGRTEPFAEPTWYKLYQGARRRSGTFSAGQHLVSRCTWLAVDQHGIAKLMCAVPMLFEGRGDPAEHRVISECPKELEVAFAGVVHAGKNRIHQAQSGFTPDASARKAKSCSRTAIGICGRLERADDSRSDCDDATASRLRLVDRRCGSLRNAVRLIKRQLSVEHWIPG